MNYYTHHINDYLTATIGLTVEEHGIYSLLLQHHYRLEVGIPQADAYKLLGATARKKREAVDGILKQFFFFEENLWKNNRCIEEVARYKLAQERTKTIRESGAARKQKSRDTRAALYALASDLGLDIHWKATADQLLAAIRSVHPGFTMAELSREAEGGSDRGTGVTGGGQDDEAAGGVTPAVTQGVTANPLPTTRIPTPNSYSVSKDTDAIAAGAGVTERLARGGDALQQDSYVEDQSGFVAPVSVTTAPECTQSGNKAPEAPAPQAPAPTPPAPPPAAPVRPTPVVTAQAVNEDAEILSEDKIAAMWMSGKALIKSTDEVSLATAGMFLGGLIKKFGNEIVHEAVEAAMIERPAAMRPWLMATCEDRKQRQLGNGGRRQVKLEENNRQVAQTWAERKAAQLAGAGGL